MKNIKISIVVPAYNESGNVEALYAAITEQFQETPIYAWELIFVDDGSLDNTLQKVKDMAERYKNVFYIEFSRNFGHQAALRAGMSLATGNAVITMDADMQHPPRFIARLIEKWIEGYDVVFTLRAEDKRLPWFKRKSSDAFYGLMGSLSDVKIDKGAADFRLLDMRVVKVINSLSESNPFLRGLVKWVGFKQIGLQYTPDSRLSGTSKYNLKSMLKLALQGITSFSEKPLHIAIWVGAVLALCSLAYLPYVIWAVSTNHALAGWSSLILTVVFLGGLQLLIMGIIGLYIGKIFIQGKSRPEYIIKDTNIK